MRAYREEQYFFLFMLMFQMTEIAFTEILVIKVFCGNMW